MPSLTELAAPPEPGDKRSMRKWTWGISVLAALGICFASWTVSDYGFAHAGDVDKKIDAALAPLKKEIADIRKTQGAFSRIVWTTKTHWYGVGWKYDPQDQQGISNTDWRRFGVGFGIRRKKLQ